MKVFIILLSTLIFLLAIKPGVDFISLQTNTVHGCCAGECETITDLENIDYPQEQPNTCDGKSCNPFQICSLCAISFSSVLSLAFTTIPYSNLKYSFQSVFISQFASDFWHPPKIV